MEATQNESPTRSRPAKNEKKLSRSINLKLTEGDFKTITERAASVGMKPTQYARKMVLDGEIKSRYTREELDLRRKIAGEANNLNQLARRANKDGFEAVGWEIAALCDGLKTQSLCTIASKERKMVSIGKIFGTSVTGL